MSKHAHTNSERKVSACHFKWLVKYGLDLTLTGASDAMRIGSLFHELLEHEGDWTKLEVAPMEEDLLRTVRELHGRYEQHYRHDPAGWRIIQREIPLQMQIPATGKKPHSRTPWWAGVLDGIAVKGEDGKELWQWEVKTTKLGLSRWLSLHDYDPQPLTYTMLARLQGIPVVGVVYDLVSTIPCLPVDGVVVKKYSNSLPRTTAERWERACEIQMPHADILGAGGRSSCSPKMPGYAWQQTIRDKLIAREEAGYWFQRRAFRVTDEQVALVREELYRIGLDLSRDRLKLRGARARIKKEADPWAVGQVIADVLRRWGPLYPRNFAECWRYNRRCELSDVCEHRDAGSCSTLVTREERSHEKV